MEQIELYANLSGRIDVLGAQLKAEHEQNVQRMDSNFTLVLEKLRPLEEIENLRADVDKHSRQISFWRGSLAVLAFLYTGALAFFGIHRR